MTVAFYGHNRVMVRGSKNRECEENLYEKMVFPDNVNCMCYVVCGV